MATRNQLVEELQQLMTALSTASAATRPTPWLNVDLSMVQLKALVVLHHRGIVRVGEVAHTLSLSPNATTAVLDRLEDEGMIRRRPDPSDRRAVLVGLTDEGTGWVEQLLSANFRAFGEVLVHLSAADLAALRQGMAALLDVVHALDADMAATASGAAGRDGGRDAGGEG